MGTVAAFLENLRPRQWTKNLLLFAGVIFAQRLGATECVVRAALGAVVFCFASGAVYLPVAFRGGLVLAVACLLAAWLLGAAFVAAVGVFFLWNWLYTRLLKRVPVLDVSGIGMSFVIRASAGVFVLLPSCPGVTISPWLLLCTFFLSLFLGFAKRRDELLKIVPSGSETRPVLRGYSEAALNAAIGISFGLTGMAYALYTVWPDTVAHFGTRNLVYTLPFVLAGMGRYLYLVYHEERGGKPHEILLNDPVLQAIVVGWVVVAVRIIGTGS